MPHIRNSLRRFDSQNKIKSNGCVKPKEKKTQFRLATCVCAVRGTMSWLGASHTNLCTANIHKVVQYVSSVAAGSFFLMLLIRRRTCCQLPFYGYIIQVAAAAHGHDDDNQRRQRHVL